MFITPIPISQPITVNLNEVEPNSNKKVQVLRGVASMAVLWHHIGASGYVDPSFKLTGFFVPSGDMRPLLFFMLSGYLIGSSVKHPLMDWPSVKTFLVKRFKRLYPVYLLAVVFTFAITNDQHAVANLLAHLVFLQGASVEVVTENAPLWSMHFEVLFYLAFIPISFFRIKPRAVVAGSLLTGLALLWTRIDIPLAISYYFGMLFWSAGLLVARANWKEINHPTSHFSALLLLIFCYHQVGVGDYVVNHLSVPASPASANYDDHPVRLVFLQFLPLCVLIIASFNNKRTPWPRALLGLVFLPPLVRIFYLLYTESFDQLSAMAWSIALFLLSFTLLLFPFQMELKRLKKGFVFLGSISYVTYLIHWPLMVLFLRFEPFSGSAATAVGRLGLYLVTTLTVAYVVEKYHRKFTKKYLIIHASG